MWPPGFRYLLQSARVRVQLRTLLAGLVFAAIVAFGIDLQFAGELPDLRPSVTIQYDLFLAEVARRTPPGASIAVYGPTRRFEPDYAFRYYRACYRLPGRSVIPLKDRDDREHLERMAQADYIAAWNTGELLPHDPVFRGHLGTLYRRTR